MEEREYIKGKCDFCGAEWFRDTYSDELYAVNEDGTRGAVDRYVNEAFLDDGGGDEYALFSLDELGEEKEIICSYCEESIHSDHDTIIVVGPEGKLIFCHRSGIGYVESYGEEDGALYLPHALHIAQGGYWKKTDAWRGYSATPAYTDELVRVLSGWHSSMESSDLADKINELTRGEFKLAFPVAVVFGLTSNVCSIGIDIFAPKGCEDKVRELLESEVPAPSFAGF